MANKAISSLTVGSSVYLNVDGVKKEFLVVHQGLPSSLYDESCNGTWLLMKDIYENRQWHSSQVNKLESSNIHAYLNNTFLNLFDSNIKNAIKQVKIPYRKNGGSGGTDQSGANGLPCKVFLLSGYELGWTNINLPYFPVDGAKLDYFTASSGGNSKRVAYLNGSAAYWWIRSPNIINTRNVLGVSYNGTYHGGEASVSYGIRPALILPSTTLVDDSGNVVTVDLTAHKTLVNGTVYTVQSGKCNVYGTVYNILKGRTLIDGTGWDITFPAPLVMPVKGDLITMNLNGTDRLYRVLKIVDGTTVEVLGMWDAISTTFSNDMTNPYAGKSLDVRLNTTWYNSLTNDAKAAIVPRGITQYKYSVSSSVYNSSSHASYFDYSTKSIKSDIGNRYVYALGIEDIEEYFGGIFGYSDLFQTFWNQASSPGAKMLYLRDADAAKSFTVCILFGSGYINSARVDTSGIARPAFQIDLSKIDFTIGGGVT